MLQTPAMPQIGTPGYTIPGVYVGGGPAAPAIANISSNNYQFTSITSHIINNPASNTLQLNIPSGGYITVLMNY
jgi:hypothetical protein